MFSWSSLKMWIEFFRIKIGIFGMCLTLLGFSFSSMQTPLLPLLLSAFFLTLFAYVLNHFFDIGEDRVLGKAHVKILRKWMFPIPILFFLFSLYLAPNSFTFYLVLFSGILSAFYSVIRLKRYPIKSFYTGGLITSLYIMGKQTIDVSAIPLAIFLIAIGHISDLRDLKGDRKMGLKTFPVIFGEKPVWLMQRVAILICAPFFPFLSLAALPSLFTSDPRKAHSLMLYSVIFVALFYFFSRIFT